MSENIWSDYWLILSAPPPPPASTLQLVYNNSVPAFIVLSAANGEICIKDAATTINDLFSVKDNTLAKTYFHVKPSGVGIGTSTPSGDLHIQRGLGEGEAETIIEALDDERASLKLLKGLGTGSGADNSTFEITLYKATDANPNALGIAETGGNIPFLMLPGAPDKAIEITASLVKLMGLSYPAADGSADEFLKTNGSGILSFAVPSVSDNAILQMRQLGTLSFPVAWDDLDFNQTDEESDTGVLEHDNTNIERGLIHETGKYIISYALVGDQPSGENMEARLFREGSVSEVIPGSPDEWGATAHGGGGGNHEVRLGRTLPVSLVAGDYVKLQTQNTSTGGTMKAGAILTITSLKGATGGKGDTGDTGPAGETLRDQVERFFAGEVAMPNLAGQGIDPAPPDIDHANNRTRNLLDDTIATGMRFDFRLKTDVDTAVNVIFKLKGKATAYVTNNIVMKMKYWAVQPGGPINPSPVTVTLGTFTMASGSEEEEEFSAGLSYGTLSGWGQNVKIRGVVYRDPPAETGGLVGNFEVDEFVFEPPRE